MQYGCIHDQHPHSNAESRELVSISTNSKLCTIIYLIHSKNGINNLLHIWSIQQLNSTKNVTENTTKVADRQFNLQE